MHQWPSQLTGSTMVPSPGVSPWKKSTTLPEEIIESRRSSHQIFFDDSQDDFGSPSVFPGSSASGAPRVAHLAKGFENEIWARWRERHRQRYSNARSTPKRAASLLRIAPPVTPPTLHQVYYTSSVSTISRRELSHYSSTCRGANWPLSSSRKKRVQDRGREMSYAMILLPARPRNKNLGSIGHSKKKQSKAG